MKFKNIRDAHVASTSTCRVEFPEIDGVEREDGGYVTPWLEIRPAGEMNSAFMNVELKKVSATVAKGRLTTDDTSQERRESVSNYARHILTGNGGGWVSDESGEEVPMPLSVEDREALLRALSGDTPDLYDRIRVKANDLRNFRR